MTGYRAPRSLRLAGAATLMAAALGGVARAETADGADAADGPNTVEGVVVTGDRLNEHPYADPDAPYKTDRSASSKFTEPLVDTPKSVTVISSQAIEDSGATSFRDLMRSQPGVTLGTGEGGNAYGDRVFIRGFDARNDVYIDGVRDPGVGSRETFAVEQVEIIKGPSSAFAGRGSTGGAVSLVSKAARPGNFGDFEVTVGTDDTTRATLDVNRQVSDTVSVRLNLMTHESNVAGRDFVFANRWGAAGAVTWKPTDKLVFNADYFHLSTDELPDWGVPYDVAHNRPFQVRRENYYGILARDFRKTFSDVYTLKGEYELSDAVTLRSTLRWGQGGNAYTASAPEQPNVALDTVRANAKRRDAVTEYLVNQTEAQMRFSTGPVSHTLTAGWELTSEAVLNRGRSFTECATLPCTGATANPTQSLSHPDPTRPWAVADNGVISRTDIGVDERAVYVLDTLKLGEQWQVLAGLRYDTYDIDFRQRTLATGVVVTREASSDFWNWHLGVVYKPLPNGTIYASLASSSNPSGEQLDSVALDYGGLDPRTVNLDPERNRSAELGTKWNLFDDHLNLTAAVFRIEKTNARVAVGAGSGAIVVLDGEQRVDGAELGASGNITSRWSMFGGLTLLDTEITDSPVAAQIGSKFPNVSETSFNLSNRWQVTDRLHLGATAIYASEKHGGTVNALATFVPSYWRYDLFGGYQITDRVGVSFNVLNLTDELYYDALYRSATPFTYVAPGRSALIKLDVEF